jgi:hypothetical protein
MQTLGHTLTLTRRRRRSSRRSSSTSPPTNLDLVAGLVSDLELEKKRAPTDFARLVGGTGSVRIAIGQGMRCVCVCVCVCVYVCVCVCVCVMYPVGTVDQVQHKHAQARKTTALKTTTALTWHSLSTSDCYFAFGDHQGPMSGHKTIGSLYKAYHTRVGAVDANAVIVGRRTCPRNCHTRSWSGSTTAAATPSTTDPLGAVSHSQTIEV